MEYERRMSLPATNIAAEGGHEHPPFLAHHFDTPEQQFQSGKLGMWVFLGTELLMFGGLFCAYAVYRHNHPDVFRYAHQYLNRTLGAVNTIILITSSLTMAWGVRCAQINARRGLLICLVLTLLGGFGFMAIKSVEYHEKWKHHLWIGEANIYNVGYKGPKEEHGAGEAHVQAVPKVAAATRPTILGLEYADANAGTADEAKIKPTFVAPAGLAPAVAAARPQHLRFEDLQEKDRNRVYSFFGIYFFMTGLHGLHVLIGMGLITWILVRSARGAFSSQYFAPVDLVGLYWHLVDLIWIFLFPLLYLIH
jgi:cytochrome c oxidase subunit 3